jgi:hypothetical protein
MKVLNTASGNPLVGEFNRKLLGAPASQQPSAGAKALCRNMLIHLASLGKLGKPVFQLFDQAQQFEYNGRHFEFDITWTHPDGAIDGTSASFLVGRKGTGFQFILFDQQRGTVFETWLGPNNLGLKLAPLVKMTLLYCAQRP